MTFNKVLAMTSVALGALLVTQVTVNNYFKPLPHRYHASWVDNANTAQEGVDQSDSVIEGEVQSVTKGPDIVLQVPSEPSGEDRIPTSVVTLLVTKKYKGSHAPGQTVQLVQTGGGSDAKIEEAPPEADDVVKGNPFVGKGQIKKNRADQGTSTASPSGPTSKESRATILEDDPPYEVGEKYVLFLKNVGDQPGKTRALAPEGRYQITKEKRLKPVTTKKGFAPKWQGKDQGELEAAIQAALPTNP